MPSPFPGSPMIRECSWKKTQREKKQKTKKQNKTKYKEYHIIIKLPKLSKIHYQNNVTIFPPITQCTKKVRHTLNNHAARFAARFSKCFRLLRSITQQRINI